MSKTAFARIGLSVGKQQSQKFLSAVKGAFSLSAAPLHEGGKHTSGTDSVLRSMQARTALVLHEAAGPRTEAVMVTSIPRGCSLDDIAHPQHGPVGHADFRLQLSERRLAMLVVC